MNKLFSFALVASLLPIAAEAGTVVNVSALCPNGTSIDLNAGTYAVSVIGTNQGGKYNGWDDATVNFGAVNATPAPTGWKDSFTLTANGATTSYVATGDPLTTSATGALATYQSSILQANSNTPGMVLLTLASEQEVTLKVSDYLFCDNWGGESFSVTPATASATPEPSTFGMIGLTVAAGLALMRKKRS